MIKELSELLLFLHKNLKKKLECKSTPKKVLKRCYETLLNFYIPHVNIDSLGLNIEACDNLLKSVELHYKLYPFLFENYYCGAIDSFNSKIEYIAYVEWHEEEFASISINKKSRNSFAHNVEARRYFERNFVRRNHRRFTFARNFKEDIDHEFGHVIHNVIEHLLNIKLEKDEIIAPLWEKVRFDIDEPDVKKMSEYSQKHFVEFIAECWAEGLRKVKRKNAIIDAVHSRLAELLDRCQLID